MVSDTEPKIKRRDSTTSVVLGEDWVSPDEFVEKEINDLRQRRRMISLNRSPIARRIISFNLQIVVLLLAAFLFLNPLRDSFSVQSQLYVAQQASLVAGTLEQVSERDPRINMTISSSASIQRVIRELDIHERSDILLLTRTGQPIAQIQMNVDTPASFASRYLSESQNLIITETLDRIWNTFFSFMATAPEVSNQEIALLLESLGDNALAGGLQVSTHKFSDGTTRYMAAVPVYSRDRLIGAVAISNPSSLVNQLIQGELESVLQIFLFAVLISIFMSLMLAGTIANPLADLAAAAEIGRDKNARKLAPDRIRIPDLTARPDEIGRLSGALRGMVTALYERLDANEQFASDVAHEIKNPLASLRSAVGTIRVAKQPDQLEKLLDVIDHDVRRLDRLVTDISNASRLDSELVKEEEAQFDLVKMIDNITNFLGQEAKKKGIRLVTDMPDEQVIISGLEARLAQVFVNIIGNAISFCEIEDVIRVWVRLRENRVLIVVEDTGPGIPEASITKIFKRFYSERPAQQFGNNSGLGLAISKQIVEAHGGVIWAENILPADTTSQEETLGARFVVGLPA